MGMRSTYLDATGCRVDKIRLQLFGKRFGCEETVNEFASTSDNIGEFMDGWKLHGYYYDDSVRWLWACAYAMEGLTKSPFDNVIEMEYEGGTRFWIQFWLDEKTGRPMVRVEYVPETTEIMDMPTLDLKLTKLSEATKLFSNVKKKIIGGD